MDKSITAIIPTWNRANCLKNCLSLIVRQTYKNLTVVVSDDGSSENVLVVADSFKDSRVKYIRGENSGRPSIPRNRAIKKATGNLLAFCDSDDYWKENKLEVQVNILEKTKLGAVCSNAYLDQTPKMYFDNQSRKLTTLDLLKVNSVICSSMVVEKKIIDKCGGFDEDLEFKAVEDYLLWLKVSLYTDIYYTSEPLLAYTTNSSDSVRLNQSLTEEVRYRKILMNLLRFALRKGKFLSVPLILLFLVRSKIKR
jgi:glycosyltransferase involved in cell wall biosynthesis